MKNYSELIGNERLINAEDWMSSYILHHECSVKFGAENQEIKLRSNTNIDIDQKTRENYIYTVITTRETSGESDDSLLNASLEQIQLLADISPKISVRREKSGRYINLENKLELLENWYSWKEKRLSYFIPDEKKQKIFIKNYESGLELMEKQIANNLPHILLLPEIYDVIFPPNQYYTYLFSIKNIPSRLVNNLIFEAQPKLVKLDDHGEKISIVMHSQLFNRNYIHSRLEKEIYSHAENFSISDFDFNLLIYLDIEKSTSKILKGTLECSEQLHESLYYQQTVKLELLNE